MTGMFRSFRARIFWAILLVAAVAAGLSLWLTREWLEERQLDEARTGLLREARVGCIAFSPLNNGVLTDKYLNGIPADSRAGHDPRYLKPELITAEKLEKVRALNEMALRRGQSLAQMALRWELRDPVVTSALIGASRPAQILENLRAFEAPPLDGEELARIDAILEGSI